MIQLHKEIFAERGQSLEKTMFLQKVKTNTKPFVTTNNKVFTGFQEVCQTKEIKYLMAQKNCENNSSYYLILMGKKSWLVS